MQSKFIVFCRAMVMLVALIGLPALAIWGLDRPIPPVVTDLIARIQSELADRGLVQSPASQDAATPMIADMGNLEFTETIGPPARREIGDSQTVQIGTVAGKSDSPAVDHMPLNELPIVTPVAAELPAGAGNSQQLLAIEQQLRRFGASHYLLERWGGDQQLYRFRCEMPFLGQSGFHHHFEATAKSPLQAMTEVLEKVDAWRTTTARRTGEMTR